MTQGIPSSKDPERCPSIAPEPMPRLDIPVLLVGAELGSERILLSACAPEDENYQRFYEAANPSAIEKPQFDVGHAEYIDPRAEAATTACATGDVSSSWVRAASATVLTAFLRWALTNDEGALAWLEARWIQDEAEGRIVVRRQ